MTIPEFIALLTSFATFEGEALFQEREGEWDPLYTARGEEGTPWGTLIEEAESAADELLITDFGCVNHFAIRELKRAGFRVYAGETDDFGWLSGCIDIKVGEEVATLVYG